MQDIVSNDVLRMGAEADNLHMRALVTALPVRLKLLDVSGSEACAMTFEPGLCNGETDGSLAASDNSLQAWLIYEPGHYEVLCPAEGCRNIQRLPGTGMTPQSY